MRFADSMVPIVTVIAKGDRIAGGASAKRTAIGGTVTDLTPGRIAVRVYDLIAVTGKHLQAGRHGQNKDNQAHRRTCAICRFMSTATGDSFCLASCYHGYPFVSRNSIQRSEFGCDMSARAWKTPSVSSHPCTTTS